MGLSLTFDHRALDGAPAAKFLMELCANLENFNLFACKISLYNTERNIYCYV